MIGWALVGTGTQTRNEIAPAIAASSRSRLVSVAGRTLGQAEELAGLYPGAAGTDRLEHALADEEVQAVYVGSPNALHHEHVTVALRAGKHVLSDKPLAVDSRQALDLIELARAQGVLLGVVYQLRNHPAHELVRDLVRRGDLGRVVALRIEYGSPATLRGWRSDRWSAGAGVVFNIGVHLFDLVRYLLEDEVIDATAIGTVPPEIDKTCASLLRLAGGPVATVLCTHEAAKPGRNLVLYLEGGTVRCDDTLHLTGAPVASSVLVERREGEPERFEFDGQRLLHRQVRSFEQAVAGSIPLSSTGEDGAAGVLICEALVRAMIAGAARGLGDSEAAAE